MRRNLTRATLARWLNAAADGATTIGLLLRHEQHTTSALVAEVTAVVARRAAAAVLTRKQ
jgi:hypothetical protein